VACAVACAMAGAVTGAMTSAVTGVMAGGMDITGRVASIGFNKLSKAQSVFYAGDPAHSRFEFGNPVVEG